MMGKAPVAALAMVDIAAAPAVAIKARRLAEWSATREFLGSFMVSALSVRQVRLREACVCHPLLRSFGQPPEVFPGRRPRPPAEWPPDTAPVSRRVPEGSRPSSFSGPAEHLASASIP